MRKRHPRRNASASASGAKREKTAAPGPSIAEASSAITGRLSRLPAGSSIRLGGEAEQLAEVGGCVVETLMLAVILIFLIRTRASQFASRRSAGQSPLASSWGTSPASATTAPRVSTSCVLGAGGFVSTPSDLVRFGLAMIRGALLAPETVELLWTPLGLEAGGSTGYGLGWFVRRVPLGADPRPTVMVGHGGNSIGGTASFMVFPEQRLVIATVTNVSPAPGISAFAMQLAGVFRPR